ncbi:MAG: glycosyltransferase family 2 protein [Candidatus Komeilibacteria bacterium]|nr:glycosyltransferase family 2 protein [Candidatus Komeilibacteria bacterium]
MREENRTIVPILIVNYNGRPYLEDCLRSLSAAGNDRIRPVVYIVDNASEDDSVAYLGAHWPEVRIVRSHSNLGYAGGNVLGWSIIRGEWPDARYIFLLNQDTLVTEHFLEPLVDYLDRHPSAGAVQPKIMLFPETSVVNSLGNVIHFLGLGYSSGSGQRETVLGDGPRRINYASGAAVLLRIEAIDAVGLFSPFMFMYLEDLDLGWRLSLKGLWSMLVPQSIVYHKYEFKRGMRQYYYFERNRLWIVLKNYRLRTLLLICPALVILEFAQLVRAAVLGILMHKLRGYFYFFNLGHIRQLLVERSMVQSMRTVSDRDIISSFSGRIDFQPLNGFLVRKIANPFFNAYLKMVQPLIRW